MAGNGPRYIAGVGDVNGDGYADLRIAASGVDVGYTDAGQAYIVYGRPCAWHPRDAGRRSVHHGGGRHGHIQRGAHNATGRGHSVTIPVSTSDMSEGTVAVISLTFTSANWNTLQTVMITGVNDTFNDGDVAYTIVLGAAVSEMPITVDSTQSDVSVTNVDDRSSANVHQDGQREIRDGGQVHVKLVRHACGRIIDLDVR